MKEQFELYASRKAWGLEGRLYQPPADMKLPLSFRFESPLMLAIVTTRTQKDL